VGFLRAADIFILLVWGPGFFKGIELSKVISDALKVTIFFTATGILFLMGWKLILGSSMLHIAYEKEFFYHKFRAVFFFATSCLLSPVAEELFFRGIIYRKIRERWNMWICTGAVSLLFALIHYYFYTRDPGIPPLSLITVLFCFGFPFSGSLIFCLGYEKTKFILTPILLHISGNLIIFLSPFFRIV